MKLKLYFVLLIFLVTTFKGYSQTEKPVRYKNIVHLEAGGIAGIGSLNYERVFSMTDYLSLSGRIGLSTLRINDFTNTFNPDILFPLSINAFYGKEHKIQVGFGQLVASNIRASHSTGTPKRETNFHTHIALGYRYQKEGGRLILGISYTPTIEFQKTYRHWGAATIGYAF